MKETVDPADPQQIVEAPAKGQMHGYRVPILNGTRDSLFVKSSHPHPPRWLGLVEPHIEGDGLPPLVGASSSGLLLVPAGERLMAVAFGYGRHLLRLEAVVQDFGLKVVLNSIEPGQIKSIDARTFDELMLYTRRGVSRDSSLSAFELDRSRDLLRSVTGRSSSGDLGSLSGAASLALNRSIELPELPKLGKELIEAYGAKHYKANFGFIDHMRAEQDPAVTAKLDEKLTTALRNKDMTEMHLAIPEAIDWEDVDGVCFSFKRKKQERTPDPKISVYRELREADQLTIKTLKSDKVEAVSALDEAELQGRWRVYDCLVFETEHAGHLYVLSGGDWYRIDKSYRDEVEEYVRGIEEFESGLPNAQASYDEAEYNAAAAAAIGGLCLDAKTIGVGGVDRVELCDILTRDGTYIHVKKRGRSSTLSHLFAQGVTSAELLLGDEKFRSDAVTLIESTDTSFSETIPATSGARDEVTVAYVVLSRGQRPEKPYGLPFFSLISLKAATERLRGAGIEVRVKEVKEIQAPSE